MLQKVNYILFYIKKLIIKRCVDKNRIVTHFFKILMLGSVVAVAFKSTFYLEIYQNNIFFIL